MQAINSTNNTTASPAKTMIRANTSTGNSSLNSFNTPYDESFPRLSPNNVSALPNAQSPKSTLSPPYASNTGQTMDSSDTTQNNSARSSKRKSNVNDSCEADPTSKISALEPDNSTITWVAALHKLQELEQFNIPRIDIAVISYTYFHCSSVC